MADSRPQETQQELFGDFSTESKKGERFPTLAKSQKPILFSTSAEQVILAAILLILAGCFVFFLGVVRGRSLASPVPGVRQAPVVQRPQVAPQGVVRVTRVAVQPGAAKAAAAPAVRTPEANAAKPYTIQLVTYKKQDLAEKEVAGLRRSGFYAFVIPSGDYFQVCVGQYAGMEDAKKDLRAFGARYKDRFLRRR
jgi:hypothetical protein